MATNPSQAIKLFLCYAREDEELCQDLEKHLSALSRQRLIDIWHDRQVSPGDGWEGKINKYLDTAQIILLLISPNFMHSDSCNNEMKRAMERYQRGEVRVIPILLRPVDWTNTPFSHLQMLPTKARPVTRWQDRDEAFEDVVKSIRQIVNEFLSHQVIASSSNFTSSIRADTSSINSYKSQKQGDLRFSEEFPKEGNLKLSFDEGDREWHFIGQEPNEQVKEILRKQNEVIVWIAILLVITLITAIVVVYNLLISSNMYDIVSYAYILVPLSIFLFYFCSRFYHRTVKANYSYLITTKRIIAFTAGTKSENRSISFNLVTGIDLSHDKIICIYLSDGSKFLMKNIREPLHVVNTLRGIIAGRVIND